MRLKTKLVLSATAVTFAIVIVLSVVFLGELLRQRIATTAGSDEVMARQIRVMTLQTIAAGMLEKPPADTSETAVHAAVVESLNNSPALNDTMESFVRYSPTVQDVSIADGQGVTVVSTDPTMISKKTPPRRNFNEIVDTGVISQAREVFGPPHVLDVAMPLDLHGRPFLVVHIGVRSTFLENNFVPWLKGAAILALIAGVISMLTAALLAFISLRPIEEISRRLDRLTEGTPPTGNDAGARQLSNGSERPGKYGLLGLASNGSGRDDAVVRVTDTIDRLDRQMRTTEAGYTDLRTNLNQMLDTLRDGVVLFTAERRAVMVSDAVAHFIGVKGAQLVGQELGQIFAEDTALGQAVLEAFERETNVASELVTLEDGREVEVSLDRIDDARSDGRLRGGRMGTLLTLRDRGSALKLEQELEVSRRLAAVGRLTAGVGHEVKNPINAMVVHLELLRTKLSEPGDGNTFFQPAMRHVDILAGEMERLDRVVQTLADFTRPMELHLRELALGDIVQRVLDLTREEMAENGVEVSCEIGAAKVRADGELLQQALLNLVLNGMQAMPEGGRLALRVRREAEMAIVEVADSGSGIAPELMPRIFELYFTTKPKGSGIGLAMTYRIVQMHGGAMEVRSEPGQGAVFTMRLPLAGGRAAQNGSAPVKELVRSS